MPKMFRLRPKKDQKKFFRPPGKIEADKKRQDKWSPEYREARRIRDSQRWKSLRDIMVRSAPVCEYCGLKQTEEVHHIIPLVEDLDLAFVPTNLACLCKECHAIAHQRDRVGDPVRDKLKQKARERENGS